MKWSNFFIIGILAVIPLKMHAATLNINALNSGKLQHYYGSWASMHGGTANIVVNDGGDMFSADAHDTIDGFFLTRSAMTFDASALPGDAIIDSVTLQVYVTEKYDNRSDCMNVVAFTPNDLDTYVGTDYTTFGTTRFATDVNISSITTSANNTFTLNSDGKNYIVNSLFALGIRTCNDIDDVPGSVIGDYVSGIVMDDVTVSGHVPVLSITYHTGGSSSSSSVSSVSSYSGSIIIGEEIPLGRLECIHFSVPSGSGATEMCDQWQVFGLSDNINGMMDMIKIMQWWFLLGAMGLVIVLWLGRNVLKYLIYLMWPKRKQITTE